MVKNELLIVYEFPHKVALPQQRPIDIMESMNIFPNIGALHILNINFTFSK